MTAQVSNQRRERRSSAGGTLFRWVLALFLLVTVGWFIYVYQQIDAVANLDEAQPADAIAVFGAAEYSGRPSPVLHLRLDHAVELYRRQVAPLIITLGGGSDKDSGNTEGAVGRDYLLANGVPFGNIIAETRSIDTEQQVHRLAAIARENNLHHIVVVSDATHLFRIRELCKDSGLDVYTSPRATIGHISNYDLAMRYFHEILSYTSLRLGLNVSWLRSWLEGREEY
jgi:uncharacterized SAM-binding protein YcdF (DUF218 family)